MRRSTVRCLAAALSISIFVLFAAGCATKADREIRLVAQRYRTAIVTHDVEELRQMVGREGLLVCRVFLSGNGTRGADVGFDVQSSDLPDNLSFAVEGEYPITLDEPPAPEWPDDLSETRIKRTKVTLDWTQLYRHMLIDAFGELSADQAEEFEGPVIHLLGDGSFCVGTFSGIGLQYTEWAVFEKQDEGFIVRAVVHIY